MSDRAKRLGLEPGSILATPLPHESEIALSIAISFKRIADHFCLPADQRVGGFSQAENNINDILSDRFSDLVRQFLAER